MAEYREALMKEDERNIHYEDNCPGCNVEKRKRSHSRIPLKHLIFAFTVCLSAALPISSLFPFLYFMIRDFHIAEREEDIGYYAGFVVCDFIPCHLPLMGTASITIKGWDTSLDLSKPLHGQSESQILKLRTEASNEAVAKAYVSEICRKEHQAFGMSLISTSWGLGLVIGPAVGGYLSQPAEKFPKIFSKESLFGRFPYLLPCLVISIFALGSTLMCCWLPETLHIHTKKDEEHEHGADPKETLQESEETCSTSQQSLLKNWPLMSAIIVYCVFQLHDMAYAEIFPLWAVSPKKYGGLSYSSSDVGQVLAISGSGLLVFQLLFYPIMERTFGPVLVSRTGAVLTIALLSSYPFIAKLSGITLTLLINCASLLKNVLSVSITTGLFLLQNRAVNQRQRGAANGLAMSAMSLFKAVGPAGGGAIFSWAQKRQTAAFLPDKRALARLNLICSKGLLWRQQGGELTVNY
ncbi:hypothetical protein TIFTF001_036521 [Ficus carica]|uniref:Uncharacterized protein n=1 Tax=Ficus carica TaxID=3494 RepID=A0AA88JAV0_FICCA|nr:hypothetical protein TIFTF001_036521 [Ficus carica]